MRLIPLPQTKRTRQIFPQMRHSPHPLQHPLINFLLILRPLPSHLFLRRFLPSSLFKERLFPFFPLLLLPLREIRLTPVSFLPYDLLYHFLVYLAFQRDPSPRRDHVARVHSTERYAVDFEGACNEDYALGEVAEMDDAFAPETTCEEDEDCAGGESWAGRRGTDGLAGLWGKVLEAVW